MSIPAKDLSNITASLGEGIGTGGKPNSPDGPQDLTKNIKKQTAKKELKPDTATIASQMPGDILNVMKSADPGNLSSFVRKALDAFMMIRMIDVATGGGGFGGGGGGVKSAALAQGMKQAAKLLSLKQILDALNLVMPGLRETMSYEEMSGLNQSILALIRDESIGVLHPLSLQEAQITANLMIAADNITGDTSLQDLVNLTKQVTALGGPTVGLDPNSLAYQLVIATIGTVITQTLNINGTKVNLSVSVDNSTIMDSLNSIPTFNGQEHITIAQDQANFVATQMVAMISGNLFNALNFTSMLSSLSSNILNSGLQSVLGVGLGGILGNISSLLPQFASGILDHANIHIPMANLNPKTLMGMVQHSKVQSIMKRKFDIATIFSGLQAMMGGLGGLGSIAGVMGGNLGGLGGMLGSLSGISGSLASLPIGQLMSTGGLITFPSEIPSTMGTLLSSGSSVINVLGTPQVVYHLQNQQPLVGVVGERQVRTILATVSTPSAALELLGSGPTSLGHMSSQDVNVLLSELTPEQYMNLTGGTIPINYVTTGDSFAEQTSDIGVALAIRVSTTPVKTKLKAMLPCGTTVICERVE